MGKAEEVSDSIDSTLTTQWDVRVARNVPTPENVTLRSEAAKLNATFLYADLAGSSRIADTCPWSTTAKIIKSFLVASTRIITQRGGVIRSFDGDRVMGIFIGDFQNTQACFAAFEINWAVQEVLNKEIRRFDSVRNNGVNVAHCCGIDNGDVYAIRAGIRDRNDLAWIGEAAGFAAKLSDVRASPYHTYISSRVKSKAASRAEQQSDGTPIWSKDTFNFNGKPRTVYRTIYWCKPGFR